MNISYIVPLCRGDEEGFADRLQNINFSLRNFLSRQQNCQVEVVIVEQSFDGKEHFILPGDTPANTPEFKVVKKTVRHKTFNKGWLCNVGARAATSNHICIADGDMFIYNDTYFANLLKFVGDNKFPWCIGWNALYYIGAVAKKKMMDGQPLTDKPHPISPSHGRSEGGIVYFSKPFYFSIGGMNEWMEGLGGMDNDIASRAHITAQKYPVFRFPILHLFHRNSPMKNAGCRRVNQAIYRYINSRSSKAIPWMAKQPIGGATPLCASVKFMNGEWRSPERAPSPTSTVAFAMDKNEILKKLRSQGK